MSAANDLPDPAAASGEAADVPGRAEGPAAAAILAGGVGCLILGLLTTLAEASVPIHDWLEFNTAVGPLSGKTTVTVILWLVAWAILHAVYKRRDVDLGKVFVVTLVLVGLGVIGTFPTFFLQFATE